MLKIRFNLSVEKLLVKFSDGRKTHVDCSIEDIIGDVFGWERHDGRYAMSFIINDKNILKTDWIYVLNFTLRSINNTFFNLLNNKNKVFNIAFDVGCGKEFILKVKLEKDKIIFIATEDFPNIDETIDMVSVYEEVVRAVNEYKDICWKVANILMPRDSLSLMNLLFYKEERYLKNKIIDKNEKYFLEVWLPLETAWKEYKKEHLGWYFRGKTKFLISNLRRNIIIFVKRLIGLIRFGEYKITDDYKSGYHIYEEIEKRMEKGMLKVIDPDTDIMVNDLIKISPGSNGVREVLIKNYDGTTKFPHTILPKGISKEEWIRAVEEVAANSLPPLPGSVTREECVRAIEEVTRNDLSPLPAGITKQKLMERSVNIMEKTIKEEHYSNFFYGGRVILQGNNIPIQGFYYFGGHRRPVGVSIAYPVKIKSDK